MDFEEGQKMRLLPILVLFLEFFKESCFACSREFKPFYVSGPSAIENKKSIFEKNH